MLSIQLYLDDEYKQILKDMGNGLSLVSVQNLNSSEDVQNKPNNSSIPVQKQEVVQEKPPVQQQQEEVDYSSSLPYEPTEQERYYFERIWDNRMQIEMQHQHLMTKAARLLCFSSNNNDSFIRKNTQIIN
jgi:hypothetical protein